LLDGIMFYATAAFIYATAAFIYATAALDFGIGTTSRAFRTSMAASTRHHNRVALADTIESVTVTRPTAHWLAVLGDAGVPCAPIQDFGQVFTDPHLLARNFYWDAPHPTAGTVRQLGSPMRFSRTPVRRDAAGPLLGEDSAELLAELGYGPIDVRDLIETRVVKA